MRQLPHRGLLAVSFAAMVGLAAGRTFLGTVAVVDGDSMVPTYQPGAVVYSVPISNPIQRGDIVVVDDRKSEYAMKRVVGMPGETVHIWRGKVFINRKLLSEPYLPKHTYTHAIARTAVFLLGEKQYFVLGDHRVTSVDSRSYGPVGREQIKRRIPGPDGALRAEFRPFTLPAPGKTLIRPIEQS